MDAGQVDRHGGKQVRLRDLGPSHLPCAVTPALRAGTTRGVLLDGAEGLGLWVGTREDGVGNILFENGPGR